VDPSIPLKLLFLLNSSSHEKLIAENALGFISLYNIGMKLIELEREEVEKRAALGKESPAAERKPEMQRNEENLTEFELIRNEDSGQEGRPSV
jgi:hypothetical protein